MTTASRAIVASSFGALFCAPIAAQVTQRVSVSSSGRQSHGDCNVPSISADGRFVAFDSYADDLVSGDTNGADDVFVRDRRSGTTERVSVDSAGAQANGTSHADFISADGRYVVFVSLASNLVAGDTNHAWDVFVRDRLLETTERVSVDSSGVEGDEDSWGGSISTDGRRVVFSTIARSIVPGDTNGATDVFVHDRVSGRTERVSVASDGAQGNSDSYLGQISADGRYVVFSSYASNLVPGDTNGAVDIFVRDLSAGTTERVNVSSSGMQAWPLFQGEFDCGISADGRYVAFWSDATNLVPGDSNGSPDVFVHDRRTGTTELVSVSSNGTQQRLDFYDGLYCWISADGRFVSFNTPAGNLAPGDVNDWFDVFVHDRVSGTTELVTVNSAGVQGNQYGFGGAMSADGRYVSFVSPSTNLVPGDTNGTNDEFVRDRLQGTAFTSLCDPGVGGVSACPCSNPASGPDRGCDNSSATGGAELSASGGSFLSSDSLVFRSNGETPTALSIVIQGNALIAGGVAYGQGIRCVGGSVLRRLFVRLASGGSITAPDLEAGDTTVSASSAARGDVIQPGESRGYFVFYRDPVVLGGCPAAATFNATQTGQVTWSP
jgi:Tol biopolymer transport system component